MNWRNEQSIRKSFGIMEGSMLSFAVGLIVESTYRGGSNQLVFWNSVVDPKWCANIVDNVLLYFGWMTYCWMACFKHIFIEAFFPTFISILSSVLLNIVIDGRILFCSKPSTTVVVSDTIRISQPEFCTFLIATVRVCLSDGCTLSHYCSPRKESSCPFHVFERYLAA
mmetsp:Transcript_9922/g.16475  ORF Transcript_9922/g.16475 Transcript_9922/m.16475 type:complete len:168 (-) Transcript_9922:87-590(-)